MVVHEWLFHLTLFVLLVCSHSSRPMRKSIDERGTMKKSWAPDRNLKSMTSLSNTRWLLYLLQYREPHSSKAKRVYYVDMWKLSYTGWAMFIEIKRTARWSPNKQTNKKIWFENNNLNFALLLLRTGITYIPSQVQFQYNYCYKCYSVLLFI